MRWGATRVFATHFSALAARGDFLDPLLADVKDPEVAVRMQAIKGAWQYWFWTPDAKAKDRIETALLTELGEAQHPWVARNLHEAVYNIADENIRYLYNNWVPLLAHDEDREKAIRGRLRVESQLAAKFAVYLQSAPPEGQKTLLRALTEFELRRSDVYDAKADLHVESPVVYNRIGNDIEQIAFFGESASKMAKALAPLLDSSDAELAGLARKASLLVRDVTLPGVNQAAGPADTGPQLHRLRNLAGLAQCRYVAVGTFD